MKAIALPAAHPANRCYGGTLALIELMLAQPEKLQIYHKHKIKLRTTVAATANCRAAVFLHRDASAASGPIESCKASASPEWVYFIHKSPPERILVAESCNKAPTVVPQALNAKSAISLVPRSHDIGRVKSSNFARL